ncbi:MAG TPA: DUF5686 family protein [Flavobacterium sp.]|jgi:hypothetical protein
MKQFTLLFLILSASLHAQLYVDGIVKDSNTKKPLPFATISTKGNSTVADAEGKFFLEVKALATLDVSYIGYSPVKFEAVEPSKFYTVLLDPIADEPSAAVVLNENPAVEIISNAIRRKNVNNPQKKLQSFEFLAYNRLLLTANPDSIEGRIDTINVGKKVLKIDSSDYKFKKFIAKQHLFQTEKVSRFQYDGKVLKETVTGTRMSGFSQPVYEILAFNLMSFSLYDEKYELFETRYNSPLADDAMRDYNYRLLDSNAIVEGRSTYMIYFKNKKRRKKSGLEGVLYIDRENFGIARAVMGIRGVLKMFGTTDFRYIPEEDLWFPVSRKFRITKGNSDADVRILGETIRFDAVADEGVSDRKREASDFSYIISESDYRELTYNQQVKIHRPSVAIEVRDEAVTTDEAFWGRYRKDSLDLRSQNTYKTLDSIVTHDKLDKKLRLGRKIINGYIPFGPIDLDLRYLASYNNYEGFRLGLGGVTNEKFSVKYRLEGYTAYGTKDGNFKYHLGGAARIGKFSGTWVGGSYTDDVREIASTSFATDKRVFRLYDPRPFNVSTFYHYLMRRVFLETKFIPNTESIWQLSQSLIEPRFNYAFNPNDRRYNHFTITAAMVSIQWNPFSQYMQTPIGRVEIEKRFPKFTFQFTKSLPKILDNDFDFAKIDARAEYEQQFLNGQKSSVILEAGYANGDVPLTHLYSTSPNNLTKDRLLQRITFAGKNSFETMYFNEFFSSQYLKMQFKHAFKRVTLFRKVRPAPVFVTRMVWGDMKKPEQHLGIEYKTLERGFYESGIELNQIYQGLGLSGFYRYGPNQLPRLEDNLSVKISFIINIGL